MKLVIRTTSVAVFAPGEVKDVRVWKMSDLPGREAVERLVPDVLRALAREQCVAVLEIPEMLYRCRRLRADNGNSEERSSDSSSPHVSAQLQILSRSRALQLQRSFDPERRSAPAPPSASEASASQRQKQNQHQRQNQHSRAFSYLLLY
jgi:hypothetical protein